MWTDGDLRQQSGHVTTAGLLRLTIPNLSFLWTYGLTLVSLKMNSTVESCTSVRLVGLCDLCWLVIHEHLNPDPSLSDWNDETVKIPATFNVQGSFYLTNSMISNNNLPESWLGYFDVITEKSYIFYRHIPIHISKQTSILSLNISSCLLCTLLISPTWKVHQMPGHWHEAELGTERRAVQHQVQEGEARGGCQGGGPAGQV